MAVEHWIDEITALAGTVKTSRGGFVHSYSVYKRADFPEALTDYPCALTYVKGVRSVYSLGGPCLDIWSGVTEFHLYENTNKQNLPQVMKYFARIRNAFAAHMNLSGKVGYCLLDQGDDEESLQLVTLQYGSEEPHLGIIARWTVKENVTGDFTPR